MSVSIGAIVGDLIQLYSFLVILWCLLSWFPNIRWYDQPFKALDSIVQPIVKPFRALIPPINGIDLSPMIAMFLLQIVGSYIRYVLP